MANNDNDNDNIHLSSALKLVTALVLSVLLVGAYAAPKALAMVKDPNADKLCLDSDAADEAYWKGFTDGNHDFHHIKRTGVTWFNDSSADYHDGYQEGWADAKVNGTMLDESCWTG
jgi:hypothetical protein